MVSFCVPPWPFWNLTVDEDSSRLWGVLNVPTSDQSRLTLLEQDDRTSNMKNEKRRLKIERSRFIALEIEVNTYVNEQPAVPRPDSGARRFKRTDKRIPAQRNGIPWRRD